MDDRVTDRKNSGSQAPEVRRAERRSDHRPRKRAGRLQSAGVIRESATALFLSKGYLGTSMDEIAARAGVSKQTIYTHFADKEQLFFDLVISITQTAEALLEAVTRTLEGPLGVEDSLREIARMYVATVMNPQRLQLRRLVIAESSRFPDLAREYYARAPERFFEVFKGGLVRFAEQGLLRVENPLLAAKHFAALVLWIPVDRALFVTDNQTPTPEQLDALAEAAVDVFLAAYGAGRPRTDRGATTTTLSAEKDPAR
jgi:TetR/AcrR family transcriptional repressor of mexJK operon